MQGRKPKVQRPGPTSNETERTDGGGRARHSHLARQFADSRGMRRETACVGGVWPVLRCAWPSSEDLGHFGAVLYGSWGASTNAELGLIRLGEIPTNVVPASTMFGASSAVPS